MSSKNNNDFEFPTPDSGLRKFYEFLVWSLLAGIFFKVAMFVAGIIDYFYRDPLNENYVGGDKKGRQLKTMI